MAPSVHIDNIEVYGFFPSIRGLRNAMNSHDKADSYRDPHFAYAGEDEQIYVPEEFKVGPADLRLMCSRIKTHQGSEMKFLRMIWIWLDLTIPINCWNEIDTYKIGTTRQSSSTMHKLGSRDLTVEDFADGDIAEDQLRRINELGKQIRESVGKEKVKFLIRARRQLTWGYLQKSTYNFNYATALTMWKDRCNHRLPEWSDPNWGICSVIRKLPLMDDFIKASLEK